MQTQKLIQHIVQWLSDYLTRSGQKGFAVGVSGGIDSAVTSSLCARTGKPVYCLEMPIHQAPDQVSRATNHVDALQKKHSNVQRIKVDLTETFDNFCKAFSVDKTAINAGIALANSQSRLRMTTLYCAAGMHQLLVAGTGNKVEDFGVGFFTKYGDGGVDLSPIADLMKSEVYELGTALGVSEAILSAVPTDGLWEDNRSDEDQIGASYPELEWAMRNHELLADADISDRQRVVMAIFRRHNAAAQHKMNPIPVCEIPPELK